MICCLLFSGYDNSHSSDGNNGFGMDSSLPNLNGMTNLPGSNNNMMMSAQTNALPITTPSSMSMPPDQRGNKQKTKNYFSIE